MRCVDCGRERPLSELRRSACRTTCYSRRGKAGTLDQLPPSRQWPRALLIEEYRLIRPQVADRAQAAARIGVSLRALDQAIKRAALAGVTGLDYRPRKKVAA